MLTHVYATSAAGGEKTRESFHRSIVDVARWTENAGMRGLLVFTDNNSLDPWSVAQFMIERTENLVPLVAVQPAYMHPYTAARMITSITSMYGRQLDVNLVAGGFVPHLRAVGSFLDHDQRYDRLVEYSTVMSQLLQGGDPVTHFDTHYEMVEAVLNPPLPPGFEPRVFLAGSSPAARDAAAKADAVRLTYPLTPSDYQHDAIPLAGAGIRVGIIARDTSEQAWRVARERYPADPAFEQVWRDTRPGFEASWLDVFWQKSAAAPDDVYWLHPFRVGGDFCPYLVGSHTEVASVLSLYLSMRIDTLILGVPRSEDDLFHAMIALREAERIGAVDH